MTSTSMADTPTHFFKIILAQTLEDKKLSIPEKFVRKFGDELSDVATLLVSNGCVWQVGLTKDGRRMWFNDGWHEFLMHHSVSAGYFLVFRYERNSNFHVLIFDMTACEIMYSSNGEKVEDDKQKYRVSGNSPLSHEKMYTPFLQYNHTKASLGSTQEIKRHQACVASSRRIRRKIEELVEGVAAEPELLVSLQDKGIHVARNFGFVSEIECKRATNVVRSFKSKNPSFMAIIRSRNIRKNTLYVPTKFTAKYLRRDSKCLIRLEDFDGKEWPVQLEVRQAAASLTKGWCEFTREKKLKSGDIVVFELIRKEDIVLKVSVFQSNMALDTRN